LLMSLNQSTWSNLSESFAVSRAPHLLVKVSKCAYPAARWLSRLIDRIFPLPRYSGGRCAVYELRAVLMALHFIIHVNIADCLG
jgi:hypothetical protein